MNRSSTISQPTAILPCGESSSWRSIKRPDEDDRACDRDREAEDDGLADGPTERQPEPEAEKRTEDGVTETSRERDPAHLLEVVVGELDADAEHQQDHADLGELESELRVRGEAGRERSDQDPGEQIADDRRETEPSGDERPDQGRGQSDGDRRDEGGLVGHGRVLGGAAIVNDPSRPPTGSATRCSR